MIKKLSVSVFLIFISFIDYSQTVEGVWKGKGSAGGMHADLELTVYFKGETLLGETYLSFPADTSFLKFSIEGSFNERDSTFKFEEKKIIAGTPGLNSNCYGNYTLKIKSTDTGYILTGSSVNYTRFPKTLCGRAGFILTKPWGHKDTIPTAKKNLPKVIDTIPAAVVMPPKQKDTTVVAAVSHKIKDTTKTVAKIKPPKKEKVKQPPVTAVPTVAKAADTIVVKVLPPAEQLPAYKKRVDQTALTITTVRDSVHINLYDNGIIDHDSVSLYLGEKLLISHKELSTHPISVVFYLDKDHPKSTLRYVAENLGEIPPNTGLLIIHTKEKEYQVTMQADFSTNNTIDFVLKE